ncbi:hypothetical protein BDK51DRAFT_53242 [Blyttiomyces helicus]|uniref:Uncharacterized protein n=1 Tax=Blyttiomyces helicus TaxID=388810 RepID=A0A4P9W6J9_9FUNG|nr:hypothetical protein BDK51DRAFT_53242 [Blyttiomyces helicus]|eukprot:RKO85756.1 hypothetical protein BDK51DRAFT_53242 [Blyttiomyces helicus]
MGDVAPFIDPRLILVLNWICVFLTLAVAIMILFPAFVAARVDGKITWKWTHVFIPLFILDALLFLGALVYSAGVAQAAEEAAAQEEADEETFMEDRSQQHVRREQRAKRRARRTLVSRLMTVGCAGLFIAFHVLIALRLDETIDWSWAAVFAPWFAVEAVNLFMACVNLAAMLREGYQTPPDLADPESAEPTSYPFKPAEKALLAIDAFDFLALRTLQAVFIALKVQGSLTWDWALVFLPAWIWLAVQLILLRLSYTRLRSLTAQHPSLKSQLNFQIGVFLIGATLAYYSIGQLVARLRSDGGSPSAGVILIPVFLVLSILFCCVCCCIPSMVYINKVHLEQEMAGGEDTEEEHLGKSRPSAGSDASTGTVGGASSSA